jgi:hypothetical protein
MYLNSDITSNHILTALKKVHDKDLWFEEVRLSSGFAWQGRIDFLSLNVSPAAGNKAVAYEVKISKPDFKRDTHEKQRGARLYSDHFYYIAPVGIIDPVLVPDWAGLKVVEWKCPKGRTPYLAIKDVITAPKRDKEPPSWGLVCSLVRNSVKHGGAL